MNGWPHELLRLAREALTNVGDGRMAGGDNNGGTAELVIHRELDMQTFDRLPPGVRWALNYHDDKTSAADLVIEALHRDWTPEALSVEVVAAVRATPGAPNPGTWLEKPHALARAA